MLALCSLLAKTFTNHQNLPPLPREFRGAWVATVDNIDWPIKRGESTAVARQQLHEIVELSAKLHLNAILLQVRPSADALYDSRREPWSEFLTGEQGRAPRPSWDPLKEAIEDAHKHGIELHAWFNPFRAYSPAQHGPSSRGHVSRTHPEWVKKYGSFLWLDPGEAKAREFSLQTFLDVVKRYDVDGIVIDDYFYPYKEKGPDGKLLDFPDDASYRKYQSTGRPLSKDDWRRSNVNSFIANMYSEVKRLKPWVKVGISPFGIYRPGIPPSIRAGVDQYADLYADAKLWLQNGWCDYFAPQLYWAIDQKAQAYGTLLNWWNSVNDEGRYIWPAVYTEKFAHSDEIPRQIALSQNNGGGVIHFSFKTLRNNTGGLADKLAKGPYLEDAAVPECAWLAKGEMPRLSYDRKRHELRKNSATQWIYYSKAEDGAWGAWTRKKPDAPYAAVPLDRYGRAGEIVKVD